MVMFVLIASPVDALQQVFVFSGHQGCSSPAGLRNATDTRAMDVMEMNTSSQRETIKTKKQNNNSGFYRTYINIYI